MEDEYKVVCALSNSAIFDDLELPRTPVSRSHLVQFKGEYLANSASDPLCLVLGYGFRGRRIERRYLRFDKIQDGG